MLYHLTIWLDRLKKELSEDLPEKAIAAIQDEIYKIEQEILLHV